MICGLQCGRIVGFLQFGPDGTIAMQTCCNKCLDKPLVQGGLVLHYCLQERAWQPANDFPYYTISR
jgi:hypothetical protein